MSAYKICPVCRGPSSTVEEDKWVKIDCFRCGLYRANIRSLETLKGLHIESDLKIALISGWIREHQNELLQEEVLVAQLTRKPPTVGEKSEKLLRGLATQMPIPGTQVILEFNNGE